MTQARVPGSGKRSRPEGNGQGPAPDSAFAAAITAAIESTAGPGPAEVLLSNGIRLRVKATPPLAIRRAVQNIVRPTPPRVYIAEQEREEENPEDPGYLQALNDYEQATFDAAINIMLLLGTEMLAVPPGLVAPDSEEWTELLGLLGLVNGVDLDNRRARYLAWLKYYALVSDADLALVTVSVGRLTGIPETEVQRSLDSFRGGTKRPAGN